MEPSKRLVCRGLGSPRHPTSRALRHWVGSIGGPGLQALRNELVGCTRRAGCVLRAFYERPWCQGAALRKLSSSRPPAQGCCHRSVTAAPRRPWRPSVEGEAKSVLGSGRGALPTEGASVPLGDLYEMVRKGRANPFWPPVGPYRRGDTQEVKKKPASPWRPVSRRGKLDQRQARRRAGLDRFALLLLAGQPCQPCQPQLVMDPHQRVRLQRLIVIGHDELCAPRPIRRMPPLQKPSVSRASPAACYRSRTVVVITPVLAVRVVVVHSRSAPPCAPASIRANDSSVRIAPARVVASKNAWCLRSPQVSGRVMLRQGRAPDSRSASS